MRLRYGQLFADAAALWRGGPEALTAVAAIFLFLPIFAVHLFMDLPDLTALEGEAFYDALMDAYAQQMPWNVGLFVIQSMGVGVILLMLLDPSQPTVSQALRRGLRLLPGLMAARLSASLAVLFGFFLLVAPGLYLMGRTFITSASYVIEPQRGPIGATMAGFGRTFGNAGVLLLATFTAMALSFGFGGMAMQMAEAAKDQSPLLSGLLWAVTAAIESGALLLIVLLEAAAYRALPPSTGT